MNSKVTIKIDRAKQVLDEMILTSIEAMKCLERNDMETFYGKLELCKKNFIEFRSIRDELATPGNRKFSAKEIGQINTGMKSEIEKYTKVNEKILDIMSRMKKEMMGKMNWALQGRSFLKTYKKQINRKNFLQINV